MTSRTGVVRSGVRTRGVMGMSEVRDPTAAEPTPPRVAEAPGRLCVCGHPKQAHQHYRPGTDCALCPCTRMKRPFTTRLFFWGR
jgi:hypothetical protein